MPETETPTQESKPEGGMSEEKIEDIRSSVKAINSLINDCHISEEEEIFPEMYHSQDAETKKKLESAKMNKLRKNWFNGILSEVQYVLDEFLPGNKKANELMQRTFKIIRIIKESERTNREQVSEAEDIAKEVLNLLEEKLKMSNI